MKKLFILFSAGMLLLSACVCDCHLFQEYTPQTVMGETYGTEGAGEFAFEGVTELMNRVYKTVGGLNLRFDIFFPTVKKFERAPLAVGFHGGGWTAGDKSDITRGFAPLIAELRANGYAVATVQYRLANPPGVVFPAPFDDAAAFIGYIKENAGVYNIDRENIGVFGFSAGAHLAMLIAYATDFDITYCISFAGPAKLHGGDPASYPRETMFLVENLFGGAYGELPELYRAGSPFYYLESAEHRQTPLMLVHDRTDIVVPFSQSEIMFEKARSLGIESELLELRGVGHDIDFNNANMREREEVMSAVLNFIYKFHKNY